MPHFSLKISLFRSLLLAFCCCMVAVAGAQVRIVADDFPAKPHVVLLGDSNTWIGGDDCSQPRGWNYWFAHAFPHSSLRSYARSGATWTHTPLTKRDEAQYTELLADNNVVANQVFRLISACESGQQPLPDLVIIAAGTNDFWFASARPQALRYDLRSVFALHDSISQTAAEGLSQSDEEFLRQPLHNLQSLAQGMRFDCLLLRKHFPKARIILLSPLQSTAFPTEQLADGTQLMVKIAQRLRIPLLRQDQISPIRAEAERKVRSLTSDGTHTSVRGAQLNGRILAQRIAQLLR